MALDAACSYAACVCLIALAYGVVLFWNPVGGVMAGAGAVVAIAIVVCVWAG